VLAQADALVLALESSGLAPRCGVINVAGRQRMLSQRMAKLALLQATRHGQGRVDRRAGETAPPSRKAWRLEQAPLSTPEIRACWSGAGRVAGLRAPCPRPAAGGRIKLAAASEELLELFDRLTEAYQHSIQVLIGGEAGTSGCLRQPDLRGAASNPIL
jgi:hypothetical protein